MAQKAPGRAERQGMTLIQVMDMFPNDTAAEAWFVEQRWPARYPLPVLRE